MRYPHIALIGKAGSGKDTVAGLLGKHAAYTRLAFADRLKEAALRVDPILAFGQGPTDEPVPYRLADEVVAHGWESAKTVPEVRRYLQEFGQTMREMDPRFWIRPVMTQILNGTAMNMPAVVTDVRYANEFRELADNGVYMIRVVRPGAGLTGEAGAHSSETELDDFATPFTIYNGGSLDKLSGEVTRLLRALRTA